MKFNQIDLRAFGRYHNCSLQIDHSKSFQLIYGQNEIGKTTFTRALIAILFGIDKSSQDAYLTHKEDLCLEALIEFNNGKHFKVTREHKLSKKLNQELHSYFSTVDKSLFEKNFILNHESLYLGSRDLVQYLRQFDVTFFEEAKAQVKLKELLERLRAESENLYKERGINPKINQQFEKFSEYRELQEELTSNYEKLFSLEKQIKEVCGKLQELDGAKKDHDLQLQQLFEKEKYFLANQEITQMAIEIESIANNLQKIKVIDTDKAQLLSELIEALHRIISQKNVLDQSYSSLSASLEDTFEEIRSLKDSLSSKSHQTDLKPLPENSVQWLDIENKLLSYEERLLEARKDFEELTSLLNIKANPDLYKDLDEVSSRDHQSLAQLDWQIQTLTTSEREEAQKVKELESELLEKKKQLESKFSTPESNYYTIKKDRELLSDKLHSQILLGQLITLSDFEKFQNLITQESLFTESIIAHTAQFISLKSVESELECLKRRGAHLEIICAEKNQKLKEKQEFLHSFAIKWRRDELTSESFRIFSEKIPYLKKISQEILSLNQDISKLALEKKAALGILEQCLGTRYEKGATILRNIQLHKNLVDENRKLIESIQKGKTRLVSLSSSAEEIAKQVEFAKEGLAALENEFNCVIKPYGLTVIFQIDEMQILISRLKIQHDITVQLNAKLEQKNAQIGRVKTLTSEFGKFDNALFTQEQIDQKLSELKTSILALQESKREFSERKSELDQQLGKLTHEKMSLSSDTTKANLDSQIHDLLFHMKENIQDYLTINLSIELILQIIRDYQEKHRLPLLEKATAHFKAMTCGLYHRVQLNMLESQSYLTCVDHKEREISLIQLSQGTRDQLYLSLKLALYETLIDCKESLPLVLDDILVQFDDRRAVSALKVIQKLSASTQVFFLTHHPHIVKLAEKTLDPSKLQIHNLDELQVGIQEFNMRL